MPKIIDEEKVFAATAKIFVTRSYEFATIQDIAEEAGVNAATLYRKYGTKANLIEQALAYTLVGTPLDNIAYTGDLRADLLAIVHAHIEAHTLHGDIIMALLMQASEHEVLKRVLTERPLIHLGMIFQIIQQYQEQGLLKQQSPMIIIANLLGPIIIGKMFERAMAPMPNIEIDAQEYVDSFLHGKAAQ